YHGDFTPQNSELAVKYLTLAANQDKAESMVLLARCYATGDGVIQDAKKAFSLYLQAAQFNHTYAIYQVGQYLIDGRSGFPPNLQKAFPWFKRAAELGDSDGQAQMALACLYGKEKNIEQGLKWLKKSIAQKNRTSHYIMGHLYWHGIAGEQDDKKAYDLIKLSAEADFAPAQFALAVMLLLGTNKAVKHDEEAGMQWLKKAAERGQPQAIAALKLGSLDNMRPMLQAQAKRSKLSYDIETLSPAIEERTEDIILAAKAGDIVAQARALCILPGKQISESEHDSIVRNFLQQDDEKILAISDNELKFKVMDALINDNLTDQQQVKVLRLLNMLAKQQLPQALIKLASIYFTGKFGIKDIQKAEQYWLQGAHLNDKDCLCYLGCFYEEKAKSDVSAYQKAFAYYERAAKQDSANSYNQLGLLYRDGLGV
ncbi:MAG: tetratricopeptide repeat protein, partial [Burkholderiales bacterium]